MVPPEDPRGRCCKGSTTSSQGIDKMNYLNVVWGRWLPSAIRSRIYDHVHLLESYLFREQLEGLVTWESRFVQLVVWDCNSHWTLLTAPCPPPTIPP